MIRIGPLSNFDARVRQLLRARFFDEPEFYVDLRWRPEASELERGTVFEASSKQVAAPVAINQS